MKSYANNGQMCRWKKKLCQLQNPWSVIVMTLYSTESIDHDVSIISVFGMMPPRWLILRLQSPCHQGLVNFQQMPNGCKPRKIKLCQTVSYPGDQLMLNYILSHGLFQPNCTRPIQPPVFFPGHPYRSDPQHHRTPHAFRPREKAWAAAF